MARRFYWYDPSPLQEMYLSRRGWVRGEGAPPWTVPKLAWKAQHPDPLADALYVIGPEVGATMKVGRSQNVAARLGQLQDGSPVPLIIRHVEPGLGCCEFDVHKLLHDRRKHGEWFDFGDDDPVITVLAALAELGALEWIAGIY